MPRITITVVGFQPQPYRFDLDRAEIRVGRGEDNEIIVDCGSVSAAHAIIKRVKGGYELHDLGSTNGVKLDGESVSAIILESGMSLNVGDTTLDFELSADEQAVLVTESSVKMLPPLTDNNVDHAAPITTGIPQPKLPVKNNTLDTQKNNTSNAQVLWIVLFVLLAIVAFVLGLAYRFEHEGKREWVESLKKHSQSAETAVDEKP
jgi:pSer/pThr/pTyr-binding forkhead associated (FHA) protein